MLLALSVDMLLINNLLIYISFPHSELTEIVGIW
jgi:hypothetical protein